jgi:hypothetical protein
LIIFFYFVSPQQVQRFIDWLEMNRRRVIYEDEYSGVMPLELRFREILVKAAEDISENDIKTLRNTRQDLTEEWLYDDTKILMVQSKWRAKKGKLHAHMVRQGKKAQKDWGIKEREEAEERRRMRSLVKVVDDEKEAALQLELTEQKLKNEHVNKVLDELRAGGTLRLVGNNEVGLAFEEKLRKERLVRKDVQEVRGIRTNSLKHALRNGTLGKRPRGHFEKLRLAQMLMSENTLRRCFLRWEKTTVKNLRLREAMLLALSRFFDVWVKWHTINIKLKQKVASAIHNYYAMYVGYSFKRWWLKTRINFTAKNYSHNGVTITYMERRDDFTIVNSNAVGAIKGELIRRIFVNEYSSVKPNDYHNQKQKQDEKRTPVKPSAFFQLSNVPINSSWKKGNQYTM